MKEHPRGARRRVAGFSLIELMVVVAIMGMLAAIVAVKCGLFVGTAKQTKVAADFDNMKKALELFRLHVGHYPSRLEELWTPPSGSTKWRGPYLDDVPPAPKDPWGHEYVYTPPLGASDYTITSYGSDGAPGGTGDAQDLTTKNIRQVLDGDSGQ